MRDVVVEIWSQGWGQLLPPTAVNQCRTRCSAISFSPFEVLDKGEGGRVGGLPELRTLVKGNYILIPFRNLVYIWLPGTSANCLQCLSLCLLGVCVQRFSRAHSVTQIHTLTDRTVEGCDSPRTLHTLVLLLCKWIILIIVSTLVFSVLGFFSILNTACWTRVMLLTVRLSSQLMWTTTPSPHPIVFVWRSWYVSKSSFLHLSVKCKEWGMLMSVVGSV